MAEFYQAVGITVRYAAAAALERVDFEVRTGEIHALVGENGAGKSTLVKVLTGAVRPTEGRLLLAGSRQSFHSPRDAQAAGIAVVYQDSQLFPGLTVWENVAATASLPARVGPFVARRATARRVERVFDEFGIDIDPMAKVGSLTAAERKMVEIARAVLLDPRFLLLDEPTATLTPGESDSLAELIRHLRANGRGIVLVTHHLDEVLSLSDRTTVLRDGRRVGTFAGAELTRDALVGAMLGRQVEERLGTSRPTRADIVLEVRRVQLTASASSVDLTVRAGEIVALVGLVGSGGTALLERLGGARRDIPCEVKLNSRIRSVRSPAEAKRWGVGFLSADRKGAGIVPDQSVAVNVALAALSEVCRLGFCDRKKMRRIAADAKQRLGIRCQDMGQTISTLSGGNQQKALVARWLVSGVKLLLIDEPTHGVDIGARAELHECLRQYASDGGSIVFATSDLDEALVLADRILVLRKGEIGTEVVVDDRLDLDRAALLALVTGLSRDEPLRVSQ